MATRVTDGERRECRPGFARLAASLLPRACIALTKSEEKERLLAVYFESVQAHLKLFPFENIPKVMKFVNLVFFW